MRIITILFILVIVINSCNSKTNEQKQLNNKLTEASRKYFNSFRDTLNTIDSFYLDDIDTLTPKVVNQIRLNYEDALLKILQASHA